MHFNPLRWTKEWTLQWGPRGGKDGLPLLSCVTGELRVYYHCSSRRERGAAGAVWGGQRGLHGAGVRAGPGSASRCPPSPHPSGGTRGSFPQSPRFSAQRIVAHVPVKSTARWPLFGGLEAQGWGSSPPPPAPPAGTGALRGLPWRAGRCPEDESGQHPSINISVCLQGICTRRVNNPSRATALSLGFVFERVFFPPSHPGDNEPRSRVF